MGVEKRHGAQPERAGTVRMERITLKRVYEAPSVDDGLRILVERLWPRGVSKSAAAIDHWMKDVAPSTPLRSWYKHDQARWAEFRSRYRAELKENREAVNALSKLCRGKRVTLVFAAKDADHSSAKILRDFLLNSKA